MVSTGPMNNQTLEALLRRHIPQLAGETGVWKAAVDDMMLFVITDEMHDRMRIMIPVATIEPDDHELQRTLLTANYDRALDAKYAVHEGMIWSTFLHRLSWLTPAALDDALEQVITLAKNTGSSYTSGSLIFGGG